MEMKYEVGNDANCELKFAENVSFRYPVLATIFKKSSNNSSEAALPIGPDFICTVQDIRKTKLVIQKNIDLQ